MQGKAFSSNRSISGRFAATLLILTICHSGRAQPPVSKSSTSRAAAVSSTASNLEIPVHILAGYGTTMKIQGTNWIDGSKFFPDGSTIERPDITIATNANTGPAAIYKAERYSMTK